MPIATPAGGAYLGAQTVALSTSTPNAVIYYTLNGSTPSATNGFVYSNPLTISASEVLKAYATATGMVASAVATNTYTILQPAATPTASPAGGSFVGNTNGDVILYHT